MTSPAIEHYDTNIIPAAKVDYLWSHPAGDADKNLWQNIEFVIIIM